PSVATVDPYLFGSSRSRSIRRCARSINVGNSFPAGKGLWCEGWSTSVTSREDRSGEHYADCPENDQGERCKGQRAAGHAPASFWQVAASAVCGAWRAWEEVAEVGGVGVGGGAGCVSNR